MQLEIDCIEWALHKIEVNKLSNNRPEGVIRTMIKDLEKRKDKTMIRSDTDDLLKLRATTAEKEYKEKLNQGVD
jgi:hypothetical protein